MKFQFLPILIPIVMGVVAKISSAGGGGGGVGGGANVGVGVMVKNRQKFSL